MMTSVWSVMKAPSNKLLWTQTWRLKCTVIFPRAYLKVTDLNSESARLKNNRYHFFSPTSSIYSFLIACLRHRCSAVRLATPVCLINLMWREIENQITFFSLLRFNFRCCVYRNINRSLQLSGELTSSNGCFRVSGLQSLCRHTHPPTHSQKSMIKYVLNMEKA